MNGDTIIVTRSCNLRLFNLCKRCIKLPYPHVRITRTTADGYLEEILKLNYEWAINIDEDAFCIDSDRIEQLLQLCKENDIDICGYPDGGVLSCRHWSPLVINPFFNIIRISSVKSKFNKKYIFANYSEHKSEFEVKAPWDLMKKAYCFGTMEEPYYPFMLWASQELKCLYLDADTFSDGLSTIALNEGKRPLLIHTWYSREYGEDAKQTRRINNAYLYATGENPPRMSMIELSRFIFSKLKKLRRLIRKIIRGI